MITDHDRSGYIGASDTAFVVGNWKTKTWEKWWMQKLGMNQDHFDNKYTKAGTNWEHRILDSLNLPNLEKDRQFIIEDLRLRVNLDGNTGDRIFEVKTYRLKNGYCPQKWHLWQVQVQMYASGIRRGELVVYGLREGDYSVPGPVDMARLRRIPVAYDPAWVEGVYLPRQRVLADCLKRGEFPPETVVSNK